MRIVSDNHAAQLDPAVHSLLAATSAQPGGRERGHYAKETLQSLASIHPRVMDIIKGSVKGSCMSGEAVVQRPEGLVIGDPDEALVVALRCVRLLYRDHPELLR